MRLINVNTFRLSEFFGSNVPNYAILSHTWDKEEVTFQDMQSAETAAFCKQSFQKIRYIGQEAKKRGLRWAWVDTCCIDKTSSAELSEAINSMYKWYQESKICFAYLVDVSVTSQLRDKDSLFRHSRWFSRGWTLQELIAPKHVEFYTKSWTFLGDKILLISLLKSITGIPEDLLLGAKDIASFSVAQRMSWASSRVTTRTEDVAYSLLGLFDINMPLLYGEGPKAFKRLQEEIIKQTDDQSIFTWSPRPGNLAAWTLGSLLAPANFQDCSDVIVLHKELGEPSAATKKGVHIDAYIAPVSFRPETGAREYSKSA